MARFHFLILLFWVPLFSFSQEDSLPDVDSVAPASHGKISPFDGSIKTPPEFHAVYGVNFLAFDLESEISNAFKNATDFHLSFDLAFIGKGHFAPALRFEPFCRFGGAKLKGPGKIQPFDSLSHNIERYRMYSSTAMFSFRFYSSKKNVDSEEYSEWAAPSKMTNSFWIDLGAGINIPYSSAFVTIDKNDPLSGRRKKTIYSGLSTKPFFYAAIKIGFANFALNAEYTLTSPLKDNSPYLSPPKINAGVDLYFP